MSIIEAIILGLIQGLTEFIPISSSGHLVLAQIFFSGTSEHLFLEWINIGTVLALLIYFRERIWSILHDLFKNKDTRLALRLLVGILPAGIIGFFLADFIEGVAFFGSVWTVVVMLFLVGVVLVILEKLPKLSHVKEQVNLPIPRVLVIGFAQAIALIPGTSRSGSTIIAGRLMGLNASKAAEFSFLLSIPIMLGVLLKVAVKAGDRAYFFDNAATIIIGNIFALISGLLAVGFLMRYLQKRSLALFGWYRIVLALIIVAILLLQ